MGSGIGMMLTLMSGSAESPPPQPPQPMKGTLQPTLLRPEVCEVVYQEWLALSSRRALRGNLVVSSGVVAFAMSPMVWMVMALWVGSGNGRIFLLFAPYSYFHHILPFADLCFFSLFLLDLPIHDLHSYIIPPTSVSAESFHWHIL